MFSPYSPSDFGLDPFAVYTVMARLAGVTPEALEGSPAAKQLERRRRKRQADTLRLAKLSAPWGTLRQLERLEENPRRSDETFSFAVLGDAEPGRFWIFRKLFNVPGIFESQVRDIQTRPVDFSIQLGDMVSRGTMPNFLSFFRGLGSWGVERPYLTVIGNHDRRFPHGRTDSQLYRACFGKTNYFFDRGAARFVVVDSSQHRITPRQAFWLDRTLDTNRTKIVLTHIPPVQLGRWTAYAGTRSVGGFVEGSEDFTRILSRRRVDRVYMGHIHAFGVQDYGGVRYVLTGGGGSPLFPCGVEDRYHHYLVVSVGPRGVRETLHSADGRSFSIPQGKILLRN